MSGSGRLRRWAIGLACLGNAWAPWTVLGASPHQQGSSPAAPKVVTLDQGEHAPRQQVTLPLRNKTVVLEYGRPALRGRTIGELLERLPANRVWRAGANGATTLVTDGDILIGGVRVPAGRYTLYVHVAPDGPWSLLVNADPGVPIETLMPDAHPDLAGMLYPRPEAYAEIAKREVARVALRRVPAAEPAEFFLITLAPARDGVSAMTLTWGDEKWTAPLEAAR